ncbi:MAG: Ig-like domain-containing protein, partial [Longimicrobiales bacterium]
MRPFRAARCIGLLAVVLLGSCVGGDGTDPSAPTFTLPLALQPVFPAGAAAAQARDINVIRVVVRAVPGGQVLTDQRFEVDPTAASWDLDISVPVVEGVTNVEILITLVHRASDGTETVEWSGQVSATLGGASSSQIRTIPVVRGPPDNLGVTGVVISPDPVPDVEEEATVQLSAAVTTDDPSATPTLFWTSSAPAVATVDPATGLVTGVTPGTATIRVDVGPASDQVSVTVTPRPTEADLSLTKTVTPASAFEGDTVTFVVVLANAGPAAVGAPEVSDVLPAGLALVSAEPTSGVYDADTGIWTPGALAAGASETLRIRARLLPGTAGTTLTNTAEILPLLEQVDPDETNDVARASVTVGIRILDIALTKTVDVTAPNAGQTVVFTVRATNSGPSAATGVTVEDRLPTGLAFVSASTSQGSYVAGTGVWTVGALANGSVATLAVTARVDAAAGTTVTNRATLSGVDQTDAVAANNTAAAAVSVTAIDLALSKSVDVATPGTGQNVVFSVTASNAGPSTATGVVVQDLLPAGLTFVSSSASVGTYANGTGTWALGSLASGGVATLSMTATVTAEAGTTIVNTATLAASDQVDTDPDNNSASATVAVTGLDLAITKTVDNATPNAGQTVAFTVTATNNGPSAATGVAISDPLPAGLTFASAT